MGNRKLFRIILSALTLAAIFATSATVYAWLKTNQSAEFQMGADNSPDITLYTARWNVQGQKYDWDQGTPLKSNGKGGSFGTALPTEGKNDVFDAVCQFGVIDNLNTINNGNFVWYCLRIHEEEGKYFQNLRLNYAEKPIEFYGSDWGTGNQQPDHPVKMEGKITANLINNTLPNLMYLAPGKTFVSATAPKDITGLSCSNYNAGGSPGNDNYIHLAGVTDGGFSGNAPKDGQNWQTDQDGYYYVYFAAYPNLIKYYDFVADLYQYMPCYLSFYQMTVHVDVMTVDPATIQ